MAKLAWDMVGERVYETGVDHGVLYSPNAQGIYDSGVAWNGLVTVTESPSGAEATPMYADNIKYLNLISAEDFGATIEAFTYPNAFAKFDGSASPVAGITVGQQTRRPFGLSYRTRVGNDVAGSDFGYKLHLVYNALAAPTEKAYSTINDSPEAITFSWEVTTTPVEVPGFKPAAQMVIDSTQVPAAKMLELENLLYGTAGVDPKLPTPTEILALFAGSTIEVVPTAPTMAGRVITIPSVTGVAYKIDGITKVGTVTITADTIVTATPLTGYRFPLVSDDDWFFKYV